MDFSIAPASFVPRSKIYPAKRTRIEREREKKIITAFSYKFYFMSRKI